MKLAAIPAVALLLFAAPLLAETHDVKMYNRAESGAMAYEPAFLHIAPGDTVRFLPAQPGHNAATIEGMIPEGAIPFKSKINETFSVTLTVPGSYGIRCSPHFAMGMVMLIKVGDAPAPVLPADLPARVRSRFEAILATHPQ